MSHSLEPREEVPNTPQPASFRRKTPRWRKGISIFLLIVVVLVGIGAAVTALQGPGIAAAIQASFAPTNASSRHPRLVNRDDISGQCFPLSQKRQRFIQGKDGIKVFLVFWGRNWSHDKQTYSTIVDTFQDLSGSAYNNIFTQYAQDAHVQFTNKVTVHWIIDDDPIPFPPINIGVESCYGVQPKVIASQVRNETDKLIKNKGWTVDPSTQIIVFPEKGAAYSFGDDYCGIHAYDSTATHSGHYAYALVEYGAQGHRCDFVGNPTGDMVWNAVHEYTEMVTDPQIFGTLSKHAPFFGAVATGWHTHPHNPPQTPQEIADLCENLTPRGTPNISFYHTKDGGPLPDLWSNKDNRCVNPRTLH